MKYALTALPWLIIGFSPAAASGVRALYGFVPNHAYYYRETNDIQVKRGTL